jgi:ABC-type phosphate/phosphonate transport system substrate-binding protein
MTLHQVIFARCRPFIVATVLAILLIDAGMPSAQAKDFVLRIGATGTITGRADAPEEKTGQDLLHRFIKEETGLGNEITGQQNWQDLSAKMAKGECHLGVFQGFEFAWAQEKYADLKPLAVGIKVNTYPVACVLVRRDNPTADFGGLKGQSLASPVTSLAFLKLFVDRQSDPRGKKEAFFSKIVPADNVEDALDDVVDGKIQSIVIEQVSLDAYKRRKPGRFKQLKEIAHSQPFPPLVVAYCGKTLDEATLRRFKSCLMNAGKKEKGEMLLTLARLTGFVDIPADFGQVLEKTRRAYPPEKSKMP